MEEKKKQTVGQLLDSEEFKKELALQIEMENKRYDDMMAYAFTKKLRLARNPINSLREREVFNAEDMTAAYKLIIVKKLNGFSSAEREYIKRVCLMAFWRVLQKQNENKRKERKEPELKRKRKKKE